MYAATDPSLLDIPADWSTGALNANRLCRGLRVPAPPKHVTDVASAWSKLIEDEADKLTENETPTTYKADV